MAKPKTKMQWVDVTPTRHRSPAEYFKMGFTTGVLFTATLLFIFLVFLEK